MDRIDDHLNVITTRDKFDLNIGSKQEKKTPLYILQNSWSL